MLTFLIDGWEDKLKRSLYGTMATQVGQYPIILSLEDMSGERGTADGLFGVMRKALGTMELEDGRNFVALTADNPTVMQKFKRLVTASDSFYWILPFVCFLHSLNLIIGKIASYPLMKKIISQTTRVVVYFNNSHYWGGQLQKAAEGMEIKRKMKQNCESRWYAMTLQSLSVLEHRPALTSICLRPDAAKKMQGLSEVSKDVRNTVLYDAAYWPHLDQLIRTTKPIVDAIGNLESRDAMLADCMLELIRCAQAMSKLELNIDEGHDIGFFNHTKAVFNRQFHNINTARHSLVLFLHPLCRSLAIGQAASGRSFKFMVETALGIAEQLHWSNEQSLALTRDPKDYHEGRGVWSGGSKDALDWWRSRPVSAKDHPLKTLSVLLASIHPHHTADVEHMFSGLNGVQSAKRVNLSVPTFEALGKCRSHYARELWDLNKKNGKSTHRKHAHMHTREDVGIDTDLATNLEKTFSFVPPLAIVHDESMNDEGLESITMEELEEAFTTVALRVKENVEVVDVDGREVLEGNFYNFDELEAIDQGVFVSTFDDGEPAVPHGDGTEPTWTISSIMEQSGF
ncbi:ribonuclease H-like domain-containing protein [Amylostereum chailletii]|nr:ribonuclease H-like domain-containing protein [Amylostereum chailletii]